MIRAQIIAARKYCRETNQAQKPSLMPAMRTLMVRGPEGGGDIPEYTMIELNGTFDADGHDASNSAAQFDGANIGQMSLTAAVSCLMPGPRYRLRTCCVVNGTWNVVAKVCAVLDCACECSCARVSVCAAGRANPS